MDPCYPTVLHVPRHTPFHPGGGVVRGEEEEEGGGGAGGGGLGVGLGASSSRF